MDTTTKSTVTIIHRKLNVQLTKLTNDGAILTIISFAFLLLGAILFFCYFDFSIIIKLLLSIISGIFFGLLPIVFVIALPHIANMLSKSKIKKLKDLAQKYDKHNLEVTRNEAKSSLERRDILKRITKLGADSFISFDFYNMDITDFNYCIFEGCIFENCNLQGGDLKNCVFIGCSFRNCNLIDTNFSSSSWRLSESEIIISYLPISGRFVFSFAIFNSEMSSQTILDNCHFQVYSSDKEIKSNDIRFFEIVKNQDIKGIELLESKYHTEFLARTHAPFDGNGGVFEFKIIKNSEK